LSARSASQREVPRERRCLVSRAFVLLVAALFTFCATKGRAEEMPVFSIEFKDGVITPLRLEVPARRAFKIELHNTGNSPAEFESVELHREKVLAPQSTSFIVFRTLDPGEYKFFDDFHPDAPQAVLVAK
jgi:hypothetical protein